MATSLCRFWSHILRSGGSYGSVVGLARPHLTKRCINVQQLLDKTVNASKTEQDVSTRDPLDVDIDPVMQAMKKQNLEVTKAAELLNSLTLALANNVNLRNEIKNDIGFQNVCELLGKQCPKLGAVSLIFSFRNLLVLGIPSTSHTLKSVETELMWKLRRMNFKNLMNLLNVCDEFKNKEMQNKVVAEIQRRWVEVTDVADTCALLAHSDKFNKDFVSKLEDRTMDIIEKAKADDIAKLFVIMANFKQRSTPLLRCMAFHLGKHPEKLETKKLANVLCAINSLSFPDHLLLQRITSDLSSEVVNIEKASIVAAILTSLGQLRWKDEGLLDGFTQWIQKNFDVCRTQDLVSYMLTITGLDYTPHAAEDLFEKLRNRLTEEAINNPAVWLDVVWAMVVLHIAMPNHLESVLRPEFYQKLHSIPNKLKLRSINAVAEYEVLDYKGPTISAEYFEDVSVARSKELQRLNLSVIDALSNFLPRGKFLAANKTTEVGVIIDAEFAVDGNAKPLPISEPKPIPSSSKKLPASRYRMALIVFDYKDFTLNATDLTGMNSLNVRLLQKLGYLVVKVPHTEFAGIKTTLNRVQYLQTKIAETVTAAKVGSGQDRK